MIIKAGGPIFDRQFSTRLNGRRQPDGESPVIRRGHLRHASEQRLAHRVARCPALDRGDAIAPAHRLAVMEAQSVAQGEGPQPAVILERVAFDHLRLRLQLAVDAVKLVPDHRGVKAGDIGGCHDRIDDSQVRLRNIAQDARGLGLREADPGQGG